MSFVHQCLFEQLFLFYMMSERKFDHYLHLLDVDTHALSSICSKRLDFFRTESEQRIFEWDYEHIVGYSREYKSNGKNAH